jgi:hypothetical protein
VRDLDVLSGQVTEIQHKGSGDKWTLLENGELGLGVVIRRSGRMVSEGRNLGQT